MTPEQELVNYLNGWVAKGNSKADLANLLRAKADELEADGVVATEETTEGQTETEGSTEGNETEE